MFVQTDNWVDVVGFRLERVHSAMFAWLLDSSKSPLDCKGRRMLLSSFTGIAGQQITEDTIQQTTAQPEFSFGRRKRIDLLVELKSGKQTKRVLVIEFKTDSDYNREQLDSSHLAATKLFPQGTEVIAIAILLGASQAWGQYHRESELEHGIRILTTNEVLEALKELSVADNLTTYHQWKNALQAENERMTDVSKVKEAFPSKDSADSWKSAGYRSPLHAHYAFYGQILKDLIAHGFKHCDIYNMANNPVLNIKMPKNDNGKSSGLLWELNWKELRIKFNPSIVGDVAREQIVSAVKSMKVLEALPSINLSDGHPTKQKSGAASDSWVSAFAWSLNFSLEPHVVAQDISRLVEYSKKAIDGMLK